MCFCETTDELIAEGWEVTELNATKRKPRVNEGMKEREQKWVSKGRNSTYYL